MLGEGRSLRHLSLRMNIIGDEGILFSARMIVRQLHSCYIFAQLKFIRFVCYRAGGRALLNAAASSGLVALNLSNADLGTESGTSLLAYLSAETPLTHLDVSNNPLLFTDGGAALQTAIKCCANSPLRSLDLRKCQIDNSVQEHIHTVIRQRTVAFEQQRRKRAQSKDWDLLMSL